jgi:hypothetical protein
MNIKNIIHYVNECFRYQEQLYTGLFPKALDKKVLHVLKIDHVGIIVDEFQVEKVITVCKKNGYMMTKRFPSVLVTDYFVKTCQCVDPRIEIIKFLNKDSFQMELFVPLSGVSQKQLKNSFAAVNHIAFSVDSSFSYLETVYQFFLRNGYMYESEGKNVFEKSKTVYWIRPPSDRDGISKIEIIQYE